MTGPPLNGFVEAGQLPTASDKVAVPLAVDQLAEARCHAWMVSRGSAATYRVLRSGLRAS